MTEEKKDSARPLSNEEKESMRSAIDEKLDKVEGNISKIKENIQIHKDLYQQFPPWPEFTATDDEKDKFDAICEQISQKIDAVEAENKGLFDESGQLLNESRELRLAVSGELGAGSDATQGADEQIKEKLDVVEAEDKEIPEPVVATPQSEEVGEDAGEEVEEKKEKVLNPAGTPSLAPPSSKKKDGNDNSDLAADLKETIEANKGGIITSMMHTTAARVVLDPVEAAVQTNVIDPAKAAAQAYIVDPAKRGLSHLMDKTPDDPETPTTQNSSDAAPTPAGPKKNGPGPEDDNKPAP